MFGAGFDEGPFDPLGERLVAVLQLDDRLEDVLPGAGGGGGVGGHHVRPGHPEVGEGDGMGLVATVAETDGFGSSANAVFTGTD